MSQLGNFSISFDFSKPDTVAYSLQRTVAGVASIVASGTISPPVSSPLTPSQNWIAASHLDADGFNTFPRAADARIVYVAGNGADANAGSSPVTAVQTLKRAQSLIRPDQGDAILFKRGDAFDATRWNDVIQTNGASPAEPLLIGAYGDASLARPIIKAKVSLGGRLTALQFVAVQSLDIQCPAPGNDNGISMLKAGEHLWIEDVRIQSWGGNVAVQSPDGSAFATLVFRRNQVLDAMGGKTQGLYFQCINDLLIDDNLLHHNGWTTPGTKDIFSHNAYLQDGNGPLVFTNNLSADAGSHGCQQRSGGTQTGNYFFRNPLGSFVALNASLVSNNVYDSAASIDAANPRGQGLEIIGCDAAVFANLFINKPDPINNASAVCITPTIHGQPTPVIKVGLHDNIVHNWTGLGLQMNGPTPPGLTDVNDDWGQLASQPTAPRIANYPDATRCLDAYAKTLGFAGADAFLSAARENRRGNRNSKLTAAAAASWVRAGFAPS